MHFMASFRLCWALLKEALEWDDLSWKSYEVYLRECGEHKWTVAA